jgi:Domain of unknown function (DUF4149)
MRLLQLGTWLAGIWAGMLLCIGLVAAPAPFATLASADAGRVVARVFAQEAYLSLAFALVLYLIVRKQAHAGAAEGKGSVVSANVLLVLGTLFCTVAGYFVVQPMLEAARAGQGGFSFGALHGASMGFFALKGLLVLGLAWRLAGR